jgi:hypothetical protein
MQLTEAQSRELLQKQGVYVTEACESCGQSPAYRVPWLRGRCCSVICTESELFGLEHCRWCGAHMGKPYTGIGSRLCSEDCEENYNAHVLGDYSAELGSGTRLLLWLQREQPDTYRDFMGRSAPNGLCQNPACKRGEDRQPASLAHLRKGSLFCSTDCRVQANRASKRILTSHFDPSGGRIKCGFSRNKTGKLISEAIRPVSDARNTPGYSPSRLISDGRVAPLSENPVSQDLSRLRHENALTSHLRHPC